MLLTFLDIAVSLVNKDGGVWTLFSQIFRTMPTAYAEGWERENVSTIRAVKYLVIGTCPRVFTVGMAQRCVVVCVQKSRRQPSVPMSFHGCVAAKIFFLKKTDMHVRTGMRWAVGHVPHTVGKLSCGRRSFSTE